MAMKPENARYRARQRAEVSDVGKYDRLVFTDGDVWRLYADEGCSPCEIAAAAGVSLKRAWAWINSIRRERYRGRAA